VGGRPIHDRYPAAPPSFVLENDGSGNMKDVSQNFVGGNSLGMISDAAVADLNGDEWRDLILVGEWAPIRVFINSGGKFEERSEEYITQPGNGWWNTITSADFDKDGDLDFIVGNLGVNAQITAEEQHPTRLYYSDIDGNGSIDPILTSYIDGVSYPVPYLDDLISQVPSVRKTMFYYRDYGKATVEDILPGGSTKGVPYVFADQFRSVVLKNEGGKLRM